MMRASAEEILAESSRILRLIEAPALSDDERRQIVEDSVTNFSLYVTKAILEHRKSCSSDYSVAEWEDEGAVFRDTAGREYIDCLGGYGVYLLGHRHPRVVAAVEHQLHRYALHSQELIDPLRGYLSKLVAMITPGDLRHTYLVNAGTEANEMAIKLARLVTGKTHIIATLGGFHGKTLGSLSATGKGLYREPYLPLVPGFHHVPFGEADAVEERIEALLQTGESVAAVIVEPIQGEGGINIPPADYLPRLREICDRYECLLIVDEVQTGMGRTGRMFGVDHWDVVPDIMTLGKAFGGGVMPIAAMVAQPKWWEKMEENPFILGSSTFGGNPLCAAGAIAGIHTILAEDIPGQARAKGEYFLRALKEMQQRTPDLFRDVRGMGLLIGLEFIDNARGFSVAKRMFDRGVLVGGTLNNARVIRIEPPAVIRQDQIDRVLQALEDSLREEAATM
ncbi:MAG: aminotransferase class III-fold pyridoxal phosphate-dependent enzyme [Kyrpidia sp.]|nr:aminotransferase class III-fold pyridoxal phosphate-dependent enzyme [Kyrpidia sp.]